MIIRKWKYVINSLILITLFSVLFCGCKKENDDSKVNQTNGLTTAIFSPVHTYWTMTDQDGNVYKTITIGSQTWMAENLRVTHYRNGDEIPEARNEGVWASLIKGAYCNPNNLANNEEIATFGRIYNWYAVSDSRNLAPVGWHVATDEEWTILISYAGGPSIAGGRLKETGTSHWFTPNTDATNEFGFTALPNVTRSHSGQFLDYMYYGVWWSTTGINIPYAWARNMSYGIGDVYRDGNYKEKGFAVRCIKD